MGKASRRRHANVPPAAPAPAPPTDATTSILNKWREQGAFVAFVDGDRHNCAAANLRWVTLREAMERIDTLVCDWDDPLTPQEAALVRDPAWRAGLTFGPATDPAAAPRAPPPAPGPLAPSLKLDGEAVV